MSPTCFLQFIVQYEILELTVCLCVANKIVFSLDQTFLIFLHKLDLRMRTFSTVLVYFLESSPHFPNVFHNVDNIVLPRESK